MVWALQWLVIKDSYFLLIICCSCYQAKCTKYLYFQYPPRVSRIINSPTSYSIEHWIHSSPFKGNKPSQVLHFNTFRIRSTEYKINFALTNKHKSGFICSSLFTVGKILVSRWGWGKGLSSSRGVVKKRNNERLANWIKRSSSWFHSCVLVKQWG
jgi:hypothetical protein